jgi:hypothetical protein
MTEVVVTLPELGAWSPELRWLAFSGCVRVESGDRESLTVNLDRGIRGRSVRLDTPTPLEVRW